jgi:hypothetical protein
MTMSFLMISVPKARMLSDALNYSARHGYSGNIEHGAWPKISVETVNFLKNCFVLLLATVDSLNGGTVAHAADG